MTLPSGVILACPDCGSVLAQGASWTCASCGASVLFQDSVPILRPSSAAGSSKAGGSKAQQEQFFDNEDPTFETERPHGQPRLYSWLIHQKFALATSRIASLLPGASVLVACGGSGMEAEFLACQGAEVINSDLSFKAVRRSIDRSRKYGFPLCVAVAEAEHLPIAARGVDFAFVHDGLHHLDDPYAGLREMLRVARVGVSVTEPAQAFVTRVAVKLGLALDVEDAGNAVGRFALQELRDAVTAAGYSVVDARRYPMYYSHEPGRVSRSLSAPLVFPVVAAAMTLARHVAGPLGNKLTLQALRR